MWQQRASCLNVVCDPQSLVMLKWCEGERENGMNCQLPQSITASLDERHLQKLSLCKRQSKYNKTTRDVSSSMFTKHYTCSNRGSNSSLECVTRSNLIK